MRLRYYFLRYYSSRDTVQNPAEEYEQKLNGLFNRGWLYEAETKYGIILKIYVNEPTNSKQV